MLGFFNGDAVNMVDLFAGRVIGKTVRFPGKREIVAVEMKPVRQSEMLWRNHACQFRDHRLGRGCIQVAFADHNPAHIIQNGRSSLVQAGCADPNDAAFTVRVLL